MLLNLREAFICYSFSISRATFPLSLFNENDGVESPIELRVLLLNMLRHVSK